MPGASRWLDAWMLTPAAAISAAAVQRLDLYRIPPPVVAQRLQRPAAMRGTLEHALSTCARADRMGVAERSSRFAPGGPARCDAVREPASGRTSSPGSR